VIVYDRRLKVLLALMIVGVAALLIRLVDLQLVRGRSYRAAAEKKLNWVELLPTVRGRLLDRRGRILAEDQPCFELRLPYAMIKGPGRTDSDRRFYARWVRGQVERIRRSERVDDERLPAEQARDIFEQRLGRTWEVAAEVGGVPIEEVRDSAAEAVRRIETIRRRVGGRIREEYQTHPIIGGLNEQQEAHLRELIHSGEAIGSATVRPASRRWYPHKAEACHIIGRVGPVDPTEVTPRRPDATLAEKMTHYFDGDLIGKSGAEKLCEPMLRGKRGYRKGRLKAVLADEAPEFGRSCRLTIDIELQRAVREAFLAGNPDRQGAVVILNVYDDEANALVAGEVLAMVSVPAYDLNDYYRNYEQLVTDDVNLSLHNRAVGVRYPPGSTFKPLAAMAALKLGSISSETPFNCQGYLHSPDAFRCWIWGRARTGHGSLDVIGGLEHSCNVYFYNVGQRLGVRRQVEFLTTLGFSDRPGTGLPEERAGELPAPSPRGYTGEARFLAIGQGRVQVTPLHVANGMASIARGGTFTTPLLVRQLADKQIRRQTGVSTTQAELVQRGMFRVVNASSGTAHKHAYLPEIQVCGKTGTAQTAPRRVDSNDDGRLDSRDRIVRSGDTAWFAGFAPYRKPKIAFAVMVEYSNKGGGPTCGPIAKDVIRICKRLGYL